MAACLLWLLGACGSAGDGAGVDESSAGDATAQAATEGAEGDESLSERDGDGHEGDGVVERNEAEAGQEQTGGSEADGDALDQSESNSISRDGSPPDETDTASGPICFATAGTTGVDVTWQGLPQESEVDVFGDDELLTSVTGGSDGVLTLFGMTAEEGSQLKLTFNAEGETITIGCGSATIPTELAMPDCATENNCDQDSEPQPGNQPADLAAGADRFNSLAIGPHVYLIITDGVEPMELYMSAGPDGSRSFEPALTDQAYLNPFTIHGELAAAMETGADVEYRLDPSSGLPTWWSVDGTARTLLCLQLDTAPPELRTGPCDPTADLIGR